MVQTWKPNKWDLGISLLIAAAFPVLVSFLYSTTGAFIPMVIYYGLAWGISKWRRGKTGYFNPMPKKIPQFFIINVFVIVLTLIAAFFARPAEIFPFSSGALITGLIWAPINAASEQLLWIYIFESWDLFPLKLQTDSVAELNNNNKMSYKKLKNNILLFRIIGIILFSLFVGTIHSMYWSKFLTTVNDSSVWGIIFILLTTVSGYLHIAVWRESKQMIFTFIPHFMLNLFPLFWTGYSMVPYLF